MATAAMAGAMKQERRARQRAAISDEIKAMARAHMARDGAAALSLRAVAAAMGLSSAAIYYYFANRDALITALIVDAYRALGAALRAVDPGPERPAPERLYAAMHAYRAWALAAPAEFELIFGAPIPGYHAPAEVTGPEARAALGVLGALFADAFAEGAPGLSAPVAVPASMSAHVEAWSRVTEQPIPLPILTTMLYAWGLGHGLVALELNGQLQPIIGDAGAFFDYSLRALLHGLGIEPPGTPLAEQSAGPVAPSPQEAYTGETRRLD